ncbi:hypothetical protein ACHAQJ_007966 [Trichoderma viride]
MSALLPLPIGPGFAFGFCLFAVFGRVLWEYRSWLTSGPEKKRAFHEVRKWSQPLEDAKLLTRKEVVDTYGSGCWQAESYEAFRAVMLSNDPVVYPCVYATKGFKAAEHRYLFLDSEDPGSEKNLRQLALALGHYISLVNGLGPNTSLVVLFPVPEIPKPVRQYHADYWSWLDALARIDGKAWPQNIPQQIDDPLWRFCFQGEGLFSLSLTPGHELRRSRHCGCFCIAFQSQSVLDLLFSTRQKKQAAMTKVRNLLSDYDQVSISPELKEYGDKTGRESLQYFLMDDNTSVVSPVKQLGGVC